MNLHARLQRVLDALLDGENAFAAEILQALLDELGDEP